MRAARSIAVAAMPGEHARLASSAAARSPTIMESSSVLPTAYSATSTRLYASTSSPATTVVRRAPADGGQQLLDEAGADRVRSR